MTAWAFTDAEDWFSFHEDSTAHEERDQLELEKWWARLHSAMPELGDSVEVIETATPQTFYETTRRKFGMIGAPFLTPNESRLTLPFPNLFLVGDTSTETGGLESIARQAIRTAESIKSRAVRKRGTDRRHLSS
jgi:phytoene dehydrogenase-like protein